LRQLADSGSERDVTFYYGARTESGLISLGELQQLRRRLPQLTFVPCLSESWPPGWDRATTGYVHDVVAAHEDGLASCDVYLCGPPPMIDAALALLESRGVPQEQIHYDKFTVTAPSDNG
jgi:propane monooxygenase reductase subunit